MISILHYIKKKKGTLFKTFMKTTFHSKYTPVRFE